MGVCFLQPLGAIAQTVHHARAKILNQNIRVIKQAFQQFAVRGDLMSRTMLSFRRLKQVK